MTDKKKLKKNPSIHSAHDALFKAFLGSIGVARDFFEVHLPEKIKAHCDLSTLTIEPTNFVDEDLRQYFLDMLFSVQIKGRTGFLLFLIEHETQPEVLTLWKMHCYLVKAIQHYLKQHSDETQLPIVVPLLFYRGEQTPYPYSMSLIDRFVDPELASQVWCQPYPLIDLSTIPDEELSTHKSVALFELVQKHIHTRDLIELLQDFLDYLNGPYASHELFKSLLWYIAHKGKHSNCKRLFETIAEQNEEYREDIMNYAQELRQEGRKIGWQEGLSEGVEKGKAEMARLMLHDNEPVEKIIRYTGLSAEAIEQLRTRH